MTAVDDVRGLGELRALSERAFQAEKADHAADVEELREWKDRALTAEQERDELGRQLRDARDMLAERNGLLRRVCIEKAYIVRDEDQLDCLPVGSIIRDAQGHALECETRPGAWFYARDRYQMASDDIPLPALVLWLPEWGVS